MRIDPKGMIGPYPALLVRTTLRHLRSGLPWGLSELEAAAGLKPGNGRALVRALRSTGLIEAAGRGAWEVTQAGRTFPRRQRPSGSHAPRPKRRCSNSLIEWRGSTTTRISSAR